MVPLFATIQVLYLAYRWQRKCEDRHPILIAVHRSLRGHLYMHLWPKSVNTNPSNPSVSLPLFPQSLRHSKDNMSLFAVSFKESLRPQNFSNITMSHCTKRCLFYSHYFMWKNTSVLQRDLKLTPIKTSGVNCNAVNACLMCLYYDLFKTFVAGWAKVCIAILQNLEEILTRRWEVTITAREDYLKRGTNKKGPPFPKDRI